MKKLLIFTLFILLSLNLYAQVPANDVCENAQAVALPSSGSLCLNSTTTNATSDGSITCDYNGPGNEVWFTFVAPNANNSVTVTPNGTSPISNVVITLKISNCFTNFHDICNSGIGTNPVTSILGLTPGTQVWISVESNGGNDGDFELCISSDTSTANPGNICSLATPVFDKSPIIFNNLDGFSASGEVQPTCFYGMFGEIPPRKDVWLRFTVGISGTLEWTATVLGSNTEYDWALFDITEGCTGTQIACNYVYLGNSSTFGMSSSTTNCTSSEFCPPINVYAGRTYALLIDNFTQNNVGFRIDWDGAFEMRTASDFEIERSATSDNAYSVNIVNKSVGSTSFLWDFGDGTSSNLAFPQSKVFDSAGTYIISLKSVGNDFVSIVSKEVIIEEIEDPTIVVTASKDTLCVGENVTLNADVNLLVSYNDRQFSSTNSKEIIQGHIGISDTIYSNNLINNVLSSNMLRSIGFTISHTNHSDFSLDSSISLTVNNQTYYFTNFPSIDNDGTFSYQFPQSVMNQINSNSGNSNTYWVLNINDKVFSVDSGSFVSWYITLRDYNSISAFSWSPVTFMNNSNSLTPIVSPDENITYTFTATDIFGRESSNTIDLVVNCVQTYQKSEEKLDNMFEIYPNPANQFINVSVSQDSKVTIKDVYGKILDECSIVFTEGMNSFKIETEKLSKGIYLVELKNKGNVFVKKFVIN
jgi:hypothetical protein